MQLKAPVVLGVLGAAVGLLVAVLLYRAYGSGATGVSSGVRSYVVRSDATVSITFEVAKDPTATALCTVRARDRDGTETGNAVVRVGPSGERSQVVSYDLATRARAVTGELTGCLLDRATG